VSGRRYVVARADELAPGDRTLVTLERREIGVFNVDGTYYALRNRCPHQGAALCEGHVLRGIDATDPDALRVGEGSLLQCPWHGWEFDVRTGQSWCAPGRWRVKTYDVDVEHLGADGEPPAPGLVAGPHRAETYPVTVEDDYVVVELGR
jgi:nitrite reductase/ring-hydroxylating ferredoxin subunit